MGGECNGYISQSQMPRARNPRRIDAPVPQQHRGAVELEAIAVGQNQRTVLEDTNKLYISKCRVIQWSILESLWEFIE